jgi:hypothetical protein
MSEQRAVELFLELQKAGVQFLIVSDGKLAYRGPVDSLKSEVIERMKLVRDELLSVVERYEERAAILEFDNGLERAEAEARALMELRGIRSPRVLNRSTDEIPSSAVYVGRPTKWGNPFKIDRNAPVEQRDQAIASYREWLLAKPELIELARRELRGKDLVCWCAPLACHADVLIKIANDA